jgi:sugar-specific transcriptional regulator TrmB
MNKQEFFQNIGFTKYEAKVLSSLAKFEKANPKEISSDSNVPQNKIYAIIKKLILIGIIAEFPNKYYKLINLNSFIQKKIREKEEKLREIKKDSKNIKLLNQKEDNFNFSLIKGQQAIMNKLAEENQKVKKEILGVQRNWKYWGEGARAINNAFKRGVKVKMIGVINDETKEKALEYKKSGAKIKAYNYKFGQYPLRFSIFDRKCARITIGKPEIPNPEDYITIWTDSKPLIAMLTNQFMQMWKECKSI